MKKIPGPWTADAIRQNLKEKSHWVERGILAIYELQTDLEKSNNATVEHNGVGFSGIDAEFLSSLAQQIQAGRKLSPKQLAIGRNKMLKYAQQLANIANIKITPEQIEAPANIYEHIAEMALATAV